MLPNVWPWTNTINVLLLKPGSEDLAVLPGQSASPLKELTMRHLRNTTYILVALSAYWFHYEWLLKQADTFAWRWVLAVCIRNVLVVHAFYGFWHWFLYDRTATVKALKSRKFNPNNIREDFSLDTAKGYDPNTCRFWSTSGTLIESAYECFMLHLWATGRAPVYLSFWSFPLWSLAWMFFVPYWRDGHFFFAHRVMHNYFKKGSPYAKYDLGAWLYRHVHSLHHRSYNTGPWSGMSMHPVEHLIYLSCVFVPSVFIAQHPMHFLFNHFHVLISPLPGHDGYAAPGGGSKFHYLHHAHFECNYGTPVVPFDRLFGSFEDGSKYAKNKDKGQ